MVRTRWRVILGIVFLLICAALLITDQSSPAAANKAQQEILDKYVYLPLVLNNYPAALMNGDFELGRVSWSELSAFEFPLILQSNLIDPEGLPVWPHSGTWAAWLGGWPQEVSILAQEVTIVADKPYLVYWGWRYSEETTCTMDTAAIYLNDTLVWQSYLCDSYDDYGWIAQSLNLSGYINQTVALLFVFDSNDPELVSGWFIDDVSFQASPGSLPESSPDAEKEFVFPGERKK